MDRARIFWQVVPVQQPVQYGRDAAHISWVPGSRSHLRTAWRRDNITWTRALQPDWEGVRSWRFCRAQIVRVWAPIFWAHTLFIRREDSTAALLLSYIMRREHFSCGAYILDISECFDVSEYFTWKQIFWVCADISRCAHIFWLEANILICVDILRCAHTFWLEANILCVDQYFRQAPIF